MKKWVFAFFMAGCAPNAVLTAEYVDCTESVTKLRVQPAEWLQNATQAAINFWSTKGVCYKLDEENPDVDVVVGDLFLDLLGDYNENKTPAVLQADKELCNRPGQAACLVAHELGHRRGLRHVNGNKYAIMNAGVNLWTCEWTEQDQNELQRVIDAGIKTWGDNF